MSTTDGGQGADDEDTIWKHLADALLTETREELSRADGKAATLMSASGVVVSVLLAGAIAGNWNPTELGKWQVLWWPGAAAGIAGVVAFATAVWPRVSHPGSKEELSYFGHVAEYKSVEDLEAALRAKVSAPVKDRTADQVLTVSRIVHAKYRCVRLGMGLLGAGLGLCVAAVTLAWFF